MKYNIEYDGIKKYVKASIEDKIELEYLKQYYSDTADVLKKHNCKRILHDLRTASVKMTIIEIDELPKLVSQMGNYDSFKRALVVSNDFKKYNFFESTSRTQRQNIKIFSSYSEAEEWLLNDEKFSSQAIPLSLLKESE